MRKRMEFSIIGIFRYWCGKVIKSRKRSQIQPTAIDSDFTSSANDKDSNTIKRLLSLRDEAEEEDMKVLKRDDFPIIGDRDILVQAAIGNIDVNEIDRERMEMLEKGTMVLRGNFNPEESQKMGLIRGTNSPMIDNEGGNTLRNRDP